MGIKFYCPNGHKLHVKAFLAGKKAICPKCGARVLVPTEAEAVLRSGASGSERDEVTQSVEIPLEASSVDDALQTLENPIQQSTSAAAANVASADPLGETPQAAWYVRPATGGQYGPASAEIMRTWLNEGRIGANSLVWRAPWPEWRSASDVFPQLSTPEAPSLVPAANGAAPLPMGHVVTSVAPTPAPPEVERQPSMAPLAQATRKRRRKNDVSLIASAVLVAISVILVIVLVLVFRSQMSGPAEEIEETPPADEETLI